MNPAPLFEVIQSVTSEKARFEILRYRPLLHTASQTRQQAGERLYQVRVMLDQQKIFSDEHLFSFSKGAVEIDLKYQNSDVKSAKRLKESLVDTEAKMKPTYEGNGEVYFKPEWNDYFILSLSDDEIMVQQGMFVCAEDGIGLQKVGPSNISPVAYKNREYLRQIKLSGSGLCVLRSPVPSSEIIQVDLQDETFATEENLVLYRTAGIELMAESKTTSFFGRPTSKKKASYTRVFKGTGTIWIAPAYSLYHKPEDKKEEK
jgi:uncharacterized protein (AIM24 family)